MKIAIIGAGPIGLSIAKKLSSLGHSVTVYEEHKSIGIPQHCAGVVSRSFIERYVGSKHILNRFNRIKLYSPSNISVTLHDNSWFVGVIDRVGFDCELYDRCYEYCCLGVRVNAVNYRKASIEVNGIIKSYDLVINAEGASHRILGKTLNPYVDRVPGIQMDLECRLSNVDLDTIQVFFSKLTPKFFIWLLPLGDGIVRVGLGSSRKPYTRLIYVLSKHPIISKQIGKYRVLRVFGGWILRGPVLKTPYLGRLLYIGDSAIQVKPLTGGGLLTGLKSVDALTKAFNECSDVNNIGVRYAKLNLDLVMKLRRQRVLVKLLNLLVNTPKTMDKAFSIISQSNLLEAIGRDLDFDNHESIPRSIILKIHLVISSFIRALIS
ncbi:MAG: NAD(P)/FAD-dependent oxidoreductase [Candidatus Methanomethylicia archaeon]